MKINIKTFALIYITLLVLAGLALAGIRLTYSPSLCFSCHEMRPEYYTWQASSHRQFSCRECHQLNLLRMAYKHVSGTYYAPIQLLRPLSGSVCLKCHDLEHRKVTASGDLQIPHDRHLQNRVDCSKCHSGVAHGGIARQKITFKTDYRKWDEELGRSWMEQGNHTRPSMEVCLNCHRLRAASLACTACHRSGMLPASHRQDGFKNGGHGRLARHDLAECHNCHRLMSSEELTAFEPQPLYRQVLGRPGPQPTFDLAAYARANDFCRNCHQKRPQSHNQPLFELRHGELASRNRQGCLSCHQLNPGIDDQSQVACNSCHNSGHSPGWQNRHPEPVSGRQSLKRECFNCHSQATCINCHKGGGS